MTEARWARRAGVVGRGRVDRAATFVVASDPGLNRLRTAGTGAVTLAVNLVVEFLVARALGVTTLETTIFMILGAVVAMMGANALAGRQVPDILRIGAFFPVAIGLGLVLGILASPVPVLPLAVFVLVMFVAVWVRRFGPPFFFYGFMFWMGYFFASFLRATIAMVPMMLLAVLIGSAIVILLASTLFLSRPRRTLALVFRSMDARARRFARACATLIDRPAEDRLPAVLHVRRERARIRDAALMSDGWAAHAPALPPGWSAPMLRRRMLDVQLLLDRVAAGAELLSHAAPDVRASASAALRAYADRNIAAVRSGCDALASRASLADGQTERAANALAGALRQLIAEPLAPSRREAEVTARAADELDTIPMASDEHGEAVTDAHGGGANVSGDFEAVATLTSGELPNSVSVATDVRARGTAWNPLARLRLSTRQAVQVSLAGALAIVAGSALSEQRYYWAVIAAFVAFTGTGSRYETVRKSLNRVLGTLAGLVAGILLANLTSGHLIAALCVVVASIFCGLYLIRVSYAYMIFFVTIMISQLYSILGEFSDALLLLRLEETAIGAGIGIIVALVVTPLSTHDTIDHAERQVLDAVATVLDDAADRLDDPDSVPPEVLDALMLSTDEAARRLDLVAAPLTHYNILERRPRALRHRIALIAGIVAGAREIVAPVQGPVDVDRARAESCRRVADIVRTAGAASHADARTVSTRMLAPVLSQSIKTGAITLPPTSTDGPAFERLVELASELTEDRRASSAH